MRGWTRIGVPNSIAYRRHFTSESCLKVAIEIGLVTPVLTGRWQRVNRVDEEQDGEDR